MTAATGMRFTWFWGIFFVSFGLVGGYQLHTQRVNLDALQVSHEELERSFQILEASPDEDSSEEMKHRTAEWKRSMELSENLAEKGEESYTSLRILYWLFLALAALGGIGIAWQCRDKNKVGPEQAADASPRVIVDGSSKP